jgi:hypothetical protein
MNQLTWLAALLSTTAASGRITKLAIDGTQPAGAHERISGRALGEINPADPLNAIITDIELAPRNARGLVEYEATFTLTKPRDRGNGILFYQVPNRGGIPAIDPILLERGYTILSSGWQGDLKASPKLETIRVPAARHRDGSSISGPVLARWANLEAGTKTLAMANSIGPHAYHRAASLEPSKAMLGRRSHEGGPVTPIAPSKWAFADCDSAPFPGKSDPGRICLEGGFDPAYLYELKFMAKDPLVLGIGFAATRDLIDFIRSAQDGNPAAGTIRHVLGWGASQSGNFLRAFLHLGFNQSESGARIFDGVNPHIAARLLAMNIRFGVLGGTSSLFEAGSDGTLWWWDGSTGLLARCRASGTCPKIVETLGSNEFWYLRASPGFVGKRAEADIALPPEVRRYYYPSTGHGGGTGVVSTEPSRPAGACAMAANPNPERPSNRAILMALAEWVVNDLPPPPSRYPRLDRGELVPPSSGAMGFPMIPGAPSPDGLINPLYNYDFGPRFHYPDVSGVITKQPPVIMGTFPMLVPKVDADGNEIAGVRSVMLDAPLGTYLGWNVTAKGFYAGRICSLTGGYIPFARTKAERVAAGDPRLSLEERYGSHAGYMSRVKAAAEKAVQDRFVLATDASKIIVDAGKSGVLR